MTAPGQLMNVERITHGRHCTCGACAAEDWTNPALAPCGMYGSGCPAFYQPIGPPGSEIGSASRPSGFDRLVDMWPAHDVDAEHERTRAAIRAALRRFEPSMTVTDELADELIAAAQTGI